MADKDVQRLLQEQREMNRINAESLKMLKEQNEVLEQRIKLQEESNRAEKEAQEEKQKAEEKLLDLTSNGLKLTKSLGKFERTDLKSAAKRRKLNLDIAKTQAEIANLREEAKKQSKEIAEVLLDQADTLGETVNQSKKLQREFNKLNTSTALFDGFSKMVKDVPVLRTAFSGFADMSKKAADSYVEFGSRRRAVMAGVGSGVKGGLQALLAGLIGGIVKGLGGIDASSVSLQRTLNLTKNSASAFTKQLNNIAKSKATLTLDELKQSAEGLSIALQSGAPASAETTEQFFTLSSRLGVSAEQAGNLYRLSTLTGETFKSNTDLIVGQVLALNDANDISVKYSDVLKDVGSASETNLLLTQRFPGGIAKAAFEARKLGLSLDSLNKTSDSLLNFQSSIEAELEAELLTGKQLNLEQARMAALMGDQAKLAEEIGKQGITSEELKGNVLEAQALAKVFGMTSDELIRATMQQETLNKLQKENPGLELTGKSLDEQIAALTEKYQKELNIGVDEARLKALEELGRDEMAAQLKAETAQKSFTNAIESAGASLGQLVAALTGKDNPLASLSATIQDLNAKLSSFIDRANRVGFTRALFGGGGTADERYVNENYSEMSSSDQVKQLKLAMAVAAQENTVDQAYINQLVEKYGKEVVKEALTEVQRKRANQSDFLRMGKSIQDLEVNDFTIKTHPKDTLVMAGGTKFGDETNALLKELISAVKQGGQVYIDGRKVGETIALNYTAVG